MQNGGIITDYATTTAGGNELSGGGARPLNRQYQSHVNIQGGANSLLKKAGVGLSNRLARYTS